MNNEHYNEEDNEEEINVLLKRSIMVGSSMYNVVCVLV